tara:strand:- start:277 stop:540 length:264 start_codon:yes stop_codon:yes gene_type:complete
MVSRTHLIYAGSELVETILLDVEWDELRRARNKELSNCDWHFMSDQSPSDEWVSYRSFLRDLPQNNPGENANDACDAWNDYNKPEGA